MNLLPLQAQDEAKELAAEYALLRKVKRGRISERDYEVAAGLAAASCESSESAGERGEQGQESTSAAGSSNGAGKGRPSLQKAGARAEQDMHREDGHVHVEGNQLQLKQKSRLHKLKKKRSKRNKKGQLEKSRVER